MDPDAYILAPPATPPPRPPKRSNQPVGVHFESPKRQRLWRKDSEFVKRPGLARQEQELTTKLNSLLEKVKGCTSIHVDQGDSMGRDITPVQDVPSSSDASEDKGSDTCPADLENEPRTRRLLPDQATHRLYDNWLLLVPKMLPEYLGYMRRAQGRLGRSPDVQLGDFCSSQCCSTKGRTSVQCLHFDRLSRLAPSLYHCLTMFFPDMITVEFESCECTPLPQVLVQNGLFPTSPVQPRIAVSIDLLDFYFALFEQSADAVSALAAALKTIYTRRGFSILNAKVSLLTPQTYLLL